MPIRFIKFTSQVDVRYLASCLFPLEIPHILYTTYVDYADDEVTQAIFKTRLQDIDANKNIMRWTNDPHSLAALANDNKPEGHAIILDGLHFLTSNLMLLTNSDEKATFATASELIADEVTLLDSLNHMEDCQITVISADVSTDVAMRSTFQGRIYQKLLGLTNQSVTDILRPSFQYIALSAGLIREYPI